MDKRIAEQLKKLAHLPNCPITAENLSQVVESYSETLGHLSDELLNAAVQAYKASGTFFPSPGDLNNKAMELQMLSVNLPTPAEAWSMFLNVRVRTSNKRCDEALRLGQLCNEAKAGEYWKAHRKYSDHLDKCTECVFSGKDVHEYGHPVVSKVVDLLGGRDAIQTGNTTADRARFIEAFRELVEKQKSLAILPPQVKAVVMLGNSAMSEMRQLAEKVSVK